MKKIIILLFLIVNNISNAQFTSNLFSIVHNFNSGNQINRIATINADSGLVTNISNQTIDGTFYLTSGAFNASGNKLYYISNNSSIVAFDSSDGTISQTPLINFYNGISYFDNVNFCISNNTLYGLFRPFDSNFNSNGIFFAKADLQTGNVTVISQGSIASNYQVAGTVIDPKLMVYYFKTGSKFLGIDLYNGSIYSNPDVIYTNGDFDFANFSYNCEDNTIYGLVREMTTIQNPNAPEGVNLQYMRFAKIDPVTGVVVRISNVPLPTSFYSANAGSTINPNDNLFYYSDSEKLYGISLLTGLVEVEELLIKNTGDVINFLNNYNRCLNATTTRLDTNLGLINNTKDEKISVAPIPSNDVLYVKSSFTINTVEIYNFNGKLITKCILNNNVLDINNLQSGFYFLKINNNDKTEFIKFIKN